MSTKPLTAKEHFNKIDTQFAEVRTDMATQFAEVRTDMATQFAEVHSEMAAQFAAMNEQLDRIATMVVKGFDRIDKALEQKASVADVQRLYGLVDSLAKRQEISDDERLIMAHQLTRLHEWVEQAAVRIDLKFEH